MRLSLLLPKLTKILKTTGFALILGLFIFQSSGAAVFAGGVVINEFMVDPGSVITDANGQWVEVHNTTGDDIDLSGWELNGAEIPAGITIVAHGTIVLCRKSDVSVNGSVKCSGQISMTLNDTGGTITLENNVGETIDSVTYTGADVETGKSTNVHRDEDNNVTGLSQEEAKTYGEQADDPDVLYGTPGENVVKNSNNDGHTYGSIQHGINDAEANDTVNVGKGEFTEDILIEKALNLIGIGDDTVIKTDNNDGAIGITISENTENVTLRNLTLKGPGEDEAATLGIYAKNVIGLVFDNLTVSDYDSGIVVENTKELSFSGINTLINNKVGLIFGNELDDETVTGKNGRPVDLGRTAFKNNAEFDIKNLQSKSINALKATFNGKTGSQMTTNERIAQDAKLFDDDEGEFGEVIFYRLQQITNSAAAEDQQAAVKANSLVHSAVGNFASISSSGSPSASRPDKVADVGSPADKSTDENIKSSSNGRVFDWRWLLLTGAIAAFLWFLLRNRDENAVS